MSEIELLPLAAPRRRHLSKGKRCSGARACVPAGGVLRRESRGRLPAAAQADVQAGCAALPDRCGHASESRFMGCRGGLGH